MLVALAVSYALERPEMGMKGTQCRGGIGRLTILSRRIREERLPACHEMGDYLDRHSCVLASILKPISCCMSMPSLAARVSMKGQSKKSPL